MSSGGPISSISWDKLKFEKDMDDERVVLGRGTFGVVYKAVFMYQHVAVKQFGEGGALSPAVLAAARREAELQGRLAHDNVVRIFGLAEENRPGARPKYAIVLALLHEPLSALLSRVAAGAHGAPDVALPLAWRLNGARGMTEGLAHLHAHRLVHADIKPQNIMLSPPRTGCIMQLTDFGLAHDGGSTRGGAGTLGGAAGGGGGVGSVGYMASELRTPTGRPRYRSDVYAMAVVIWQLLAVSPSPYPDCGNDEQVREAVRAGRRPDLAALPAEVPPALPAVLASAWAEAPGDRPRSGCELLEILLEAAPPALTPPPLPPALGGEAAGVGGGGGDIAAAAEAARGEGLGRAPDVAEWHRGLVLAECPLCLDEGAPGVALGCPGGHEVCNTCALRTVRAELVPGATMVRCPRCLHGGGAAAAAPVAEAAVAEVAAWSADPSRVATAVGDLRALGPDELARFARVEAERRARAEAEAARRAAEAAAAPLPEDAFKRCPGCGEGIQHPRGHACHHIKPGTGCPTCGTHFCYVCLSTGAENEAARGSRSRCACPRGSWSTFCSAACDCPDCLDCAPGRPCDECDNDGRCFVCQPARRPPPPPTPAQQRAAAAEAEQRRAREAAARQAREAEAEQRRAREAAARRAREAEAEQRRAREAAARHQGGAAEEPQDGAAMRRQYEVTPPQKKRNLNAVYSFLSGACRPLSFSGRCTVWASLTPSLSDRLASLFRRPLCRVTTAHPRFLLVLAGCKGGGSRQSGTAPHYCNHLTLCCGPTFLPSFDHVVRAAN